MLQLFGCLDRQPPASALPSRPAVMAQRPLEEHHIVWHLKDSDERADGFIAGARLCPAAAPGPGASACAAGRFRLGGFTGSRLWCGTQETGTQSSARRVSSWLAGGVLGIGAELVQQGSSMRQHGSQGPVPSMPEADTAFAATGLSHAALGSGGHDA